MRKLCVAALLAAVLSAVPLGRAQPGLAPGQVRPEGDTASDQYVRASQQELGVVNCANLIYGRSKTSVCFADEFLSKLQKDSHIRVNRRFYPVKLGSPELLEFPFVVMTGEGAFSLSQEQRRNMRRYLLNGGFLVASAGCSCAEWDSSFRSEVARTFPDLRFQRLEMSHPIFHTVYDVGKLDNKRGVPAHLEALIYEDNVVLVYSREGLNDTHNAGPGCCCCGGNEIYNAIQVNANLLAYALTH